MISRRNFFQRAVAAVAAVVGIFWAGKDTDVAGDGGSLVDPEARASVERECPGLIADSEAQGVLRRVSTNE